MGDLKFIEDIRDRHAGEDIWVTGAGSSMDDYPIDFFEDKICIGMNNVFSVFTDLGDSEEKLKSRTFYSLHHHDLSPSLIIKYAPQLLKNCFFLLPPERKKGMVWWEDYEDYNDVIHYMRWGLRGGFGVSATVEDFKVMADCIMKKEGACSYVSDGTTLHWAIPAAVVLGAKKIYVVGAEAIGGHMQKHGSFYVKTHPPGKRDLNCGHWRLGTRNLARIFKLHGIDIVFYYYDKGEVDPETVTS